MVRLLPNDNVNNEGIYRAPRAPQRAVRLNETKSNDRKQTEAQSALAESARNGVNHRSIDVTQLQQRPEMISNCNVCVHIVQFSSVILKREAGKKEKKKRKKNKNRNKEEKKKKKKKTRVSSLR